MSNGQKSTHGKENVGNGEDSTFVLEVVSEPKETVSPSTGTRSITWRIETTSPPRTVSITGLEHGSKTLAVCLTENVASSSEPDLSTPGRTRPPPSPFYTMTGEHRRYLVICATWQNTPQGVTSS
jgi:hypothetical protein